MGIRFIHRCDRDYTDESIYHEMIKGADVNAPIEAGITYLMLAQSEKLVRELLARGADPNAVDIDGKTALFCRENEKEPFH